MGPAVDAPHVVTSPSERSRALEGGDGSENDTAHPQTVVRGDEPAARCPYCDRPFRERRLETLHRGREHPDRLSADEREAFERAYQSERRELRRFRLLALGAVILCYFGFLLLYAVVT